MTQRAEEVTLYIVPNREDVPTADKIRLLAARYCADRGIALPGDDPFRICRTERGKPVFEALPQVHLSVSHSGAYFVCAFGAVPLGIDLQEHDCLREEESRSARRLCEIANRFFHPQEAAWVEEDPAAHFFRVLTAKESFVKYTGRGMDETFGEVSVLPGAGDGMFDAPDGEVLQWQAGGVNFCSVSAHGYTLCLCTESPCRWIIACHPTKNAYF